MRAESQPSAAQPRYHKMRVGEVIRILQSCPQDAVIQCEGGGLLVASEWSNWAEVEIIERPNRAPIVKTKWL